ncbi:MAG: dephospho-CoA kinase [Bacillota bacterium]
MIVVGLTGGIASGKSTVSNYLKKLGAVVIDADDLSRQAVMPGEKAWRGIKEYFGGQVLNSDGTLNRKRLAEIVFNNPQAREALNEIVHPEVINMTKESIARYKKEGKVPLVVVDAPLLIEAGMEKLADEVWVVDVQEELQIKRVMERDGLSREGILGRLKSQMPTKEKLKYAHRIIDNNNDLATTFSQVEKIWKEVTEK